MQCEEKRILIPDNKTQGIGRDYIFYKKELFEVGLAEGKTPDLERISL